MTEKNYIKDELFEVYKQCYKATTNDDYKNHDTFSLNMKINTLLSWCDRNTLAFFCSIITDRLGHEHHIDEALRAFNKKNKEI